MNLLNSMLNKIALNKLKHENELAALAATYHNSSNEFPEFYGCDETANQCFFSSFKVSV